MSRPLEGLRVIDCSHGLAGSRASGILADYGADVVWVEPPGGDSLREHLKIPYSVFNRGKRSIVLDLPSQREQLDMLLQSADVLITSWRPGVDASLSLGYEDLHARFPALVVTRISGFGEGSPHGDLPGYESLVHAVIGTMGYQAGWRPAPIYEGLPFASLGAAYLAVVGTMGALLRRDADGIGRLVETSLYDGVLAYTGITWQDVDKGQGRHDIGGVRLVCRPYACSDGEDTYLAVHTGSVGGWRRFIQLVGLDDRVASDPDGMDLGRPLTPEERTIIEEELPPIFAKRTRDEWLQDLWASDLAAVPVRYPGESFDDPQVRHNKMIVRVDDPVLGQVEQVAPSLRFDGGVAESLTPAPLVGEHSDAVLAESRNRPRGDCDTATKPDRRPLLSGVRVLDLGSYHAGPYAARILADLGADVIKLEPPRGDVERGMRSTFRNAQAGKRAICVDLKREEAAEARRRLFEWADIVVHNMRPGVAERLGAAADDVHAANRRAVYLHAPGWGVDGPMSNRQSFEPLQSYLVGAGFEAAGQFNPPVMPLGIADPGAGLLSAIGMLIGLWQSRRSDRGVSIENPQLNAALAHVAHIVRTTNGEVLGAGSLDPAQTGVHSLDRLYETADGWICLAAYRDEHLSALSTVVGVEIQANQRFASRALRQENDAELSGLLANAIGARRTGELLDALRGAGVPAIAPALDNSAVFRDPVNREVGRIAEIPDDVNGHVRETAVLVRASDATLAEHGRAPELAEHTAEVLAEVGMSSDEIAELLASGVVR